MGDNPAMTDEFETEPQPPAKPEPVKDTRPSILFAAPMNILDITSGAALSMRTMLAALAARGFRAVAVQAQLFDSDQGAEHVIEAGSDPAVKDKQILQPRRARWYPASHPTGRC